MGYYSKEIHTLKVEYGVQEKSTKIEMKLAKAAGVIISVGYFVHCYL